jgi:hypothetical protein
LKSVSFENDNSLWSSPIELKFWIEIKDIYLMCLKISRSLELLRPSCKSFCVQVPVWGDFKESSKISHFMKSNELKFWEIVVDIALHVSENFQKDSRSYVSSVASQSCYDRSLHWEDIKINFWSGTNTTWENLKGVWRLGSTNTLSRPYTKVWYVIMYLIPYKILYEIHTYT